MHMISINCETAATAAAADVAATVVTAEAVNIPTVIILNNNFNSLENCANSTENGVNEKGKSFPMTVISSYLPVGEKSILLSEISMAVAMRIQSTLRHLNESHQNVLSCVINLMIKYW